MRDVIKGDDPQIAAVVAIVTQVAPDVLLLTEFDYDLDGLALAAFADQFGDLYPYRFALQPNTGRATGLDMDRNGRLGEARDAQGYGRFVGDGGMALLSRFPVDGGAVTDLSDVLWRDLPGAVLPQVDGQPFLPDDVLSVQRLSTTGHWIVPIIPPGQPPFALLAFAATPPVFDGPEDRNGLRNRDELHLWEVVLDGGFGAAPDPFVIVGNANLDPLDGAGDSAAMAAFLGRPQLQDPLPGRDTADWPQDGPGNLRVSYVLPSATWQITDAAVVRPLPDVAAGPHHLVWVDIRR